MGEDTSKNQNSCIKFVNKICTDNEIKSIKIIKLK